MKLEERAIGQFPLSVATSLALESLCNIHPDHSYPEPPLWGYQELWINMKTLFRNLMGALEKGEDMAALPVPVAEALLEEMEAIKQIVADYSSGKCKVVFYISNYEGMAKKYPRATLRMDNTEKQKFMQAFYVKTIEALNKIHPDHGIELFKLKLEPKQRTKALILTHIAYDLVSHPSFEKLTLIESHTGALKDREKWYTKYYNGREIPNIPFREDLLQVFGDSETFRPMAPVVKKDLIDLATKYRWSSLTTFDKILFSIENLTNPYLRDLLKAILHR